MDDLAIEAIKANPREGEEEMPEVLKKPRSIRKKKKDAEDKPKKKREGDEDKPKKKKTDMDGVASDLKKSHLESMPALSLFFPLFLEFGCAILNSFFFFFFFFFFLFSFFFFSFYFHRDGVFEWIEEEEGRQGGSLLHWIPLTQL